MKNYFYWLLRVFELALLATLTLLVIKFGFNLLSKKDTILNVVGAFVVLFSCLSSAFYSWWWGSRIVQYLNKQEEKA